MEGEALQMTENMRYVTISEVEYHLLQEFLAIGATPNELKKLYEKTRAISQSDINDFWENK